MRRASPPGAAEYSLLGLLRLQPRHGYELAEQFAPAGELGGIFRLHPSLLYAHLKRLESAGHISAAADRVGSGPIRQVYTVTAAGEAALRGWITRPVQHNRDIRVDFLLKLYFARRLDPAATAGLLVDQLVIARGWADRLGATLAGASAESFARLVGELRLTSVRATIEWLERRQADPPHALDLPAVPTRDITSEAP